MPAKSLSQQRTAAVALQVKDGRRQLSDVNPEGFRRAVQSMMSMSREELVKTARSRRGMLASSERES